MSSTTDSDRAADREEPVSPNVEQAFLPAHGGDGQTGMSAAPQLTNPVLALLGQDGEMPMRSVRSFAVKK